MFCTKCGKEVPAHCKFCQNCGEPIITSTSTEVPKSLSEDIQTSNETTPETSSPKKKGTPKKSRKKLLLLCGIPVLAILAIVFIFIYKNENKKNVVVDGLRYRREYTHGAILMAVEDPSSLPKRLEIPSHVKIGSDTCEVTSINLSAFCDCEYLTRIELPDTVSSIDQYAFRNCTSLKQIDFPSSRDPFYIGREAFSGCTSLTEIKLPESLTSLQGGVFSDCTSLEEVIIPDSVSYIGSKAFKGCSSLREVIIPDSVTDIGSEAFKGCSSLREVFIPGSVQSISDGAFDECPNLTEVVVPSNLAPFFRLLKFSGVAPDLNIIYWD